MRHEDRRALIFLILILATCGIPLVAAALFQNVLLIVVALGYLAFDLYWFYIRYYKKRKPRYPMVPPEGKADIYSRANIPRPIHEDFRRMEEKKKMFANLNKLRRRRGKEERLGARSSSLIAHKFYPKPESQTDVCSISHAISLSLTPSHSATDSMHVESRTFKMRDQRMAYSRDKVAGVLFFIAAMELVLLRYVPNFKMVNILLVLIAIGAMGIVVSTTDAIHLYRWENLRGDKLRSIFIININLINFKIPNIVLYLLVVIASCQKRR